MRLLIILAVVTVLGTATGRATVYPEQPPPAHTGGFAEPTCHRCHFDNGLNEAGGALRIDGVPAVYDTARTYRLRVVLGRAAMGKAGFQLSARFAEGERAGKQAGVIAPLDDRVAVLRDSSGVQYVYQTAAGTGLAAPDTASWTFTWTAPGAHEPVVFHVASNAANDDASEFGDFVYTTEQVVEGASGSGY